MEHVHSGLRKLVQVQIRTEEYKVSEEDFILI
jgi:hypothetical protein